MRCLVTKSSFLYVYIYNDIYEKILTKEFKNKLPTELELSKRYNASRVTIRKALDMLQKNGYISRYKKSGSFINTTELNSRKNKKLVPVIITFNDYVNRDIVKGIMIESKKYSVATPIHNTFSSSNKEREYLLQFLNMEIDGLLLYPSSPYENLDLMLLYYRKGIPVVFIDNPIFGIKYPTVTSDNYTKMYLVTKKVIEKGYQNIAYYGINIKINQTQIDRLTGFCDALRESKIDYNANYMFKLPDESETSSQITQFSSIEEYRINHIKNILEDLQSKKTLPQIICCTNDIYAATLYKACTILNIPVPSKIGIIGFDDINLEGQQLSTIHQNFIKIGTVALQTINQLISGEQTLGKIIVTSKIKSKNTAYIKNYHPTSR